MYSRDLSKANEKIRALKAELAKKDEAEFRFLLERSQIEVQEEELEAALALSDKLAWASNSERDAL